MSSRAHLVLVVLATLAAAPAAAQEIAPEPPAPYLTSTTSLSAAPEQVAPPPATQASAYRRVEAPERPVSSMFPRTDRRGRVLTGTRHEMQSDRGLWGAGLGLLIGGWALDIVGTAIFNAVSRDRDGAVEEDAMAWSIVPLVGPFVQLGIEAPHPALPLTSGLMQIGGLVLFCLGLTTEHDVEIPIYGYADAGSPVSLGFDMRPMDGGGYASLTLHTM